MAASRINEIQVRRVLATLTEGGMRCTTRQLYYAACADAETPPSNAAATGQAGLGVLVLLLGLIFLAVRPVGFVLLGAGGLLLLAGLAARVRRPPLPGRVLLMSYAEFAERFSGLQLDGVITETAPPAAGASPDDHVAVICDTNGTAALVASNLAAAGLPPLQVSTQWAEGGGTAICLHDASPTGCATVAGLQDRGVRVVDAGLRPRDLAAEHAEQVLEGPPARLPADLSAVCDAAEIEWLRSGRRVELATRTPHQVMAMLADALKRTGV